MNSKLITVISPEDEFGVRYEMYIPKDDNVESGTVLFETREGPYAPVDEKRYIEVI